MIQVPPMAESINEGNLNHILKQAGEQVGADEEVATIETDKIDVSVISPEAGMVTEVFVPVGDVVSVGQNLMRIDTDGATSSTNKEDTNTSAASTEKKDVGTCNLPRGVMEPQTPSPLQTGTPNPPKLDNVHEAVKQAQHALRADSSRPRRTERTERVVRSIKP